VLTPCIYIFLRWWSRRFYFNSTRSFVGVALGWDIRSGNIVLHTKKRHASKVFAVVVIARFDSYVSFSKAQLW